MLRAAQRYGARCLAAPLAAAMILCAAPVGAQEKAAAPAKPRQLSLQNEPWTGDFDQMLERRIIRVLAPYSRTLYYVDQGHERGITAGLVREFERYVNRRGATVLAQGFFDRWRGAKDICSQVLSEAGAAPK